MDWVSEFVEFGSINMKYIKLHKESRAEIREMYLKIVETSSRMRRRFTSLFLYTLITCIRDEGALEHINWGYSQQGNLN